MELGWRVVRTRAGSVFLVTLRNSEKRYRLEEAHDGYHRRHGKGHSARAGNRTPGRRGDTSAPPGRRPPVWARRGRDPCHRALEPARVTVADLERGDEPGDGLPERAVSRDHRAGPAGRRD